MKLLLLLWWKKTHLVPPITFSLKQVWLDTNLCIASPSEVTTIRNLNGLQDIISAMNCTCAPRERGSRRTSAEHVHFRGTKYETRVDVGQCIRCRMHGESWIMLLESFRFEDEDEIYLEVFLASILKNYTPPESFIILLSRWYSRLPITPTLANSNLALTRTKIDFNTNFKTEAHVSTPRSGQYLTYAHNHITRAVAAMDSCFALTGAHQHSTVVESMDGRSRVSKRNKQ